MSCRQFMSKRERMQIAKRDFMSMRHTLERTGKYFAYTFLVVCKEKIPNVRMLECLRKWKLLFSCEKLYFPAATFNESRRNEFDHLPFPSWRRLGEGEWGWWSLIKWGRNWKVQNKIESNFIRLTMTTTHSKCTLQRQENLFLVFQRQRGIEKKELFRPFYWF